MYVYMERVGSKSQIPAALGENFCRNYEVSSLGGGGIICVTVCQFCQEYIYMYMYM